MNHLFELQKKYSLVAKNSTVRERIQILKKLEEVIESEQDEIAEALKKDFKKSKYEAYLTEIFPVVNEIRHYLKNLYLWSRPQQVAKTMLHWSASSEIQYEAKGVCLIIAPWNYPFNLAISPLIAAIAAGNTVIIKPSELTPHTANCMTALLAKVFAPQWVAVVQGGVAETQELLKLPFDHIFFTGSSGVGKIVMEAAAKHLTPVTLELGGKSPTIITEDADLAWAASKIAWGKFLNAGQTCVAPDYVLVHQSRYIDFVKSIEEQLRSFFVTEFKNSEDYCRIISQRHADRLTDLLNKAQSEDVEIKVILDKSTFQEWEVQKIAFIEQRFCPPILVLNPKLDSALMQEEIFGPILPILPYQDLNEALSIIQNRSKPLALYIFSQSDKQIQQILNQTSSGGVCVNDVMIHLSQVNLPFGGIGTSGLGNYHGEFGFRTFSHSKAILRQGLLGRWMKLVYPPYSEFKYKLLRILSSLIA